MILVTGATGTSGAAIVNALVGLGVRFRAMVRDPARARPIELPGVELVTGDFNDPASLERALGGVERALLLSNPDPEQIRLQSNFIQAVKRAGVRHVVKFSAQGAAPDAPNMFARWHGQTEDELKRAGLAWTMLQPTFFMQNLLGLAEMIKGGTIYYPAGEGRAAHVDVRDVAAVAARCLTEAGHEGRSYVITGPADVSFHDVAQALSRATGRSVQYVDIPRDAAMQFLLQTGMPQWMAEGVLELNDLLKAGKMAGVTNVVRDVGRKEPTTIDAFAREHADRFR